MILQDLLKKFSSGKADYGDNWQAMRAKVFLVYSEALSSNCTRLAQMIQVVLILLSFLCCTFSYKTFLLIDNVVNKRYSMN